MSLLIVCVVACAVGGLLVAGVRSNRLQVALPAVLVNAGPLWVGDFCRDNVAHHRYPPGWCPRNYTLYVIFRIDKRGLIYPVMEIPSASPLPPAS